MSGSAAECIQRGHMQVVGRKKNIKKIEMKEKKIFTNPAYGFFSSFFYDKKKERKKKVICTAD